MTLFEAGGSIAPTIQSSLEQGARILEQAEVPIATPLLDARVLLEWQLELEPHQSRLMGEQPLTSRQWQSYHDLLERRARGEPVDRIVGGREFWGLWFAIGPGVFSPRPETELLVESALGWLDGYAGDNPHILELCTGCGAVAIALLHSRSGLRMLASDRSIAAVWGARGNAVHHGLEDRLALVAMDGLDALSLSPGNGFDLILANPPYIPASHIGNLPVEVREHDPHSALDGGPQGLDAISAILSGSYSRLRTGGALMVEIGFDQGDAVEALFAKAGFGDVKLLCDLAGHHRVAKGIRQPRGG